MAKQYPSKKKTISKPQPQPQFKSVPQPMIATPEKVWWQKPLFFASIVALTAFLLYSNTLTHDYTQDDAIVIQENMFTKQGIEGIPGILQYDTFYGFFKEEGKANLVAGGRYRPFTLILFAVCWEFFGDNPTFFHFMNVIWFTLTCVVCYLWLAKMLQPVADSLQTNFIAFATALLFAAHPIHVEAVANIKGLDEIMTLLGSISALYFAFRAADEKKWILLLPVAVLFFIGLLSKENAITFLGIAPLSFFVFRYQQFRKYLLPLGIFVSVSVLFLSIRFSILKDSFAEPSTELMNNPYMKIVNNEWIGFNFQEWSATIIFTLGKYVQLLFFPHPLTHDYYPRHIEIMNWGNWQVLASLLLYSIMIVYALLRLPKRDILSYAILFYLMTLSIVSNVIFPIGTNMGERFLFMPSVGFCLFIAVLLWRGNQTLLKEKITSIRQHQFASLALGAIVVLFAFKTVTRNAVWKDNFTLFTTDINTSPRSAKLRNGTAGVLLDQALKEKEVTQQQNMFLEAKGHLLEAINIHPTYKNAYLLLGNANNYLKNYEESVTAYQQALLLDPSYEEARDNLTLTYRDAGQYFGEQRNDIVKSIAYLEAGNQFAPNQPDILRLLGIAYGISGRPQDAIRVLEQAIKVAPDNASILYNLGAAFGQIGNAEAAKKYFDQAKVIDPNLGN